MYSGKKIVVVMPAYNAARTVTQTVDEVLQQGIVDEIILVDDRSRDDIGVRCGVVVARRAGACARNEHAMWATAGNQKDMLSAGA